ncbi:22766_t:CDS:1, partial [Gigaspora rosea]
MCGKTRLLLNGTQRPKCAISARVKRDSELNGTWNTGNVQHEVQSQNKETPMEDKKQVLVTQHEKQVQDTNLDDTKS